MAQLLVLKHSYPTLEATSQTSSRKAKSSQTGRWSFDITLLLQVDWSRRGCNVLEMVAVEWHVLPPDCCDYWAGHREGDRVEFGGVISKVVGHFFLQLDRIEKMTGTKTNETCRSVRWQGESPRKQHGGLPPHISFPG